MKYIIMKTIDNPYIYNDEVHACELFASAEDAANYVGDVLVPVTKEQYMHKFGAMSGCQVITVKTKDSWEVEVSCDKVLGGVQTEPQRVETTRFEIAELNSDSNEYRGIPVEAKASADYVLNVGEKVDDLEPTDAFVTLESAKIVADHYAKLGKFAEVVYMPEDDVNVNDVFYRTWQD